MEQQQEREVNRPPLSPEQIEAEQAAYLKEHAKRMAAKFSGKKPNVLHPEALQIDAEMIPFLQRETEK